MLYIVFVMVFGGDFDFVVYDGEVIVVVWIELLFFVYE